MAVEFYEAVPMASSSVMSLAVLVRSELVVRRLVEVLDRDGLVVRIVYAGLTDLPLDLLERRPDAVLLQASGRSANAEALVRRTRAALPQAGIVVICSSCSSRSMAALLDAGADGIVPAEELERSLPAVVRAAIARQISVPRSLRHLVNPPALSQREKEILALVAAGLTNGQIATRLYLAESTVKTHLSSAFRRLGVRSRREAAALVLSSDDGMRRWLLPASPQI
jgi:DNA-binding NarL/FixJ family response regulator